jgi:hypothetical protein
MNNVEVGQSLNVITRDAVLQELHKLKPELEKRYGVTKIGIFGSVARNEIRADSDIDVVIKMCEPDPFSMVHIKETLGEDFNRPVDIIRYQKKW